jgi:hypothetical protein
MTQAIQVAGSLLVLIPFVLVQFKQIRPSSRTYSVFNLVGSTILAIQAAQGRQWGFLLLEGVWAVVSLVGLIRARSPRPDKEVRRPARTVVTRPHS